MPKLNDVRIYARGGDGEEFSAKCTTSVTVEGVFTIHVPKELVDTARAILKTGWKDWPAMEFDYSRDTPKVRAKLLADLSRFLTHCAVEYLKCEVVKTRVIRYSYQASASFWLTKAGKIEPNGAGDAGDGNWWEAKNEGFRRKSDMEYFSIGLAASVSDRVDYKRATGTKTVYTRIEDKDIDKHGLRLKYFACGPEDGFDKEMPYTPEAAEFFCKAIVALCEMARRFDAFFGDDAKVNKAIADGTLPKLTA